MTKEEATKKMESLEDLGLCFNTRSDTMAEYENDLMVVTFVFSFNYDFIEESSIALQTYDKFEATDQGVVALNKKIKNCMSDAFNVIEKVRKAIYEQ